MIQDKLLRLGRKLHGKDGWPVLRRNEPEWDVWRAWYIKNGVPVRFMDTRPVWTVPTELPPLDLDEALKEAGAGKLSKRLAS